MARSPATLAPSRLRHNHNTYSREDPSLALPAPPKMIKTALLLVALVAAQAQAAVFTASCNATSVYLFPTSTGGVTATALTATAVLDAATGKSSSASTVTATIIGGGTVPPFNGGVYKGTCGAAAATPSTPYVYPAGGQSFTVLYNSTNSASVKGNVYSGTILTVPAGGDTTLSTTPLFYAALAPSSTSAIACCQLTLTSTGDASAAKAGVLAGAAAVAAAALA